MAIIKLVIAFFLSFTQLVSPYFVFAFNGGIDRYFEDWSATDEFTSEYAVELEKDPNKDFVVLDFTDIQINDGNLYGERGIKTKNMITKMVEETKPDLITLTGDNASGDITYLKLIELFDSFKIPWAPVMGNHDGNNGKRINEGWDAYVLSNSEYCLFKFGPKGMGYGNYIINITENGKIIHTLFMMDTHSSADDKPEGVVNYGYDADGNAIKGYDHLWNNQIEWYKWAVNGISKIAGHTVDSSVWIHIPVYELNDARDLMCDPTTDENGKTVYTVKEEYSDTSFGALSEGICSPEGNNGFFTVCKELGSTKDIIFGHDHVNDISLVYEGIRLSYSLKGGYGSYYFDNKVGSSVLTIDSDGHTDFYHQYDNAE